MPSNNSTIERHVLKLIESALNNAFTFNEDLRHIVIIVIIVFINLKWCKIHENPTSRGKWRDRYAQQ